MRQNNVTAHQRVDVTHNRDAWWAAGVNVNPPPASSFTVPCARSVRLDRRQRVAVAGDPQRRPNRRI
jgi:hypothetical protein